MLQCPTGLEIGLTRQKTSLTIGVALLSGLSWLLFACQSAKTSPAPEHSPENSTVEIDPRYRPQGSPVELGLAGYAKVLCSAVFVSERDIEEARRNSGYMFLPEKMHEVEVQVDLYKTERRVVLSLDDGFTRSARYVGDQGCVIERPNAEQHVFFEPTTVSSTLPEADLQPWPAGDASPPEPTRDGLVQIDRIVDLAFADPKETLTAAFLVVHRGRIIAERYAPGVNKDTQLESWSMGKSLTATLVGLLIQQGLLDLDDPAPVPAWQEEDDPRRNITIRNLLNMSSGLLFIAPRDPDFSPEKGYPDHIYIYTGAVDVFDYSIHRPLQFPANTEGRYRNCDPLTLGYIVRETVRASGGDYLTFPQQALFDRIGIRRQVLETDPYGNFLLTGYDYGTARNWARLGLLYLQDGVWQEERLLPEGFVEFVSTPAPAWTEPVYGGLFWLNRKGDIPLPTDAYYMAGGGGQRVFIVPSLDLVVVRMGHFRGSRLGMEALNEALGELTSLLMQVPPN